MSFWRVRVEQVSEILPIEGADKIELAKIKGWQCVVKKGEFKQGDYGVYFPIDSVLPDDPRYAFLGANKRIKTKKLLGQISQGLFLPVSMFHEDLTGENLADVLGVTKYEPQMRFDTKELAGLIPGYIMKTDQERLQNIPEVLESGGCYEITEKLDGMSLQVYWDGTSFEVCSRNYRLKRVDNALWKLIDSLKIEDILRSYGKISLQGELIGPKIQGNIYKLKILEWYIFDIWDIMEQKLWSPKDCRDFCEDHQLLHVPVLDEYGLLPKTVEEALKLSGGKSFLNEFVEREGIVFKEVNAARSFKVINNTYLLRA